MLHNQWRQAWQDKCCDVNTCPDAYYFRIGHCTFLFIPEILHWRSSTFMMGIKYSEPRKFSLRKMYTTYTSNKFNNDSRVVYYRITLSKVSSIRDLFENSTSANTKYYCNDLINWLVLNSRSTRFVKCIHRSLQTCELWHCVWHLVWRYCHCQSPN